MKTTLLISVLIISTLAQASWKVPEKFEDPDFKRAVPREAKFSPKEVLSLRYVEAKAAEWKACHQRSGSEVFAQARDPLATILETSQFVSNLQEMEQKKLQKAQVSNHPWSGDYWAYASGILGNRYRDPAFERLNDWKSRYDYIQKNSVSLVLKNQGQEGVAFLSPAEKYDLIVGNAQSEFSNALWGQGQYYYEESGTVEEWMGICHGWAPAAIMEPRPAKSVDVVSSDGQWKIHLTPSEIKGLTSYSWATNHFPAATLGKRCNEKNPKKDRNGRFLNPDCFDLNPGSWHVAVVNLIGAMDRSFVMDATYDYEVWNQPVIGYSYTYFNPVTSKDSQDLKSSTVALQDWKQDPYRNYRSSKTVNVVGVKMRVGYVVETSADEAETDSVEQDVNRWVQYEYDLELDAQGKILGGEWHTPGHPDFIWTPKKDSKPYSPMESTIAREETWSDGQPVPENWAHAAREGSEGGYILNQITEKILQNSSDQRGL